MTNLVNFCDNYDGHIPYPGPWDVTCNNISFKASPQQDTAAYTVLFVPSIRHLGKQIPCQYTEYFRTWGSSYTIPETCGGYLLVIFQVFTWYPQFCIIDATDMTDTNHIGCYFWFVMGGPIEQVFSPNGKSEGNIYFDAVVPSN